MSKEPWRLCYPASRVNEQLDEGVFVISTNVNELERVLLRSGDDLYRLALLLCGDEAGAAQALIKATRRLAGSGAAPTQLLLLHALIEVLPHERRRWRLRRPPTWAQSRAIPPGRAALLAALV